MRECFAVAAVLSCLSIVAAGGTPATRPVKGTSVVRADARGRLVRTTVAVPERIVAPKVISPVEQGTVQRTSGASSAAPEAIGKLVDEAAQRHQMDPLLVHSVIQVESNYNSHAVSPKGAQGLMQLIPATARRFGVNNPFDPKQNIEAGVKYLKYLNDLFPNDLRLALAAYNAGEGAVSKFGNSIPPYAETEQYVMKVGQRYGEARRKAAVAKPQAKAAQPASTPAATLPAEPRPEPVEQYVGPDGRLYLRTRPAAEVRQP